MTRENLILATILVAVLGFFGYRYYTGTDEYIARAHYQEGLQASQERDYGRAVEALSLAWQSPTKVSADAALALQEMVQRARMDTLAAQQTCELLEAFFPVREVAADYPALLADYAARFEPREVLESGRLYILLAQIAETEDEYLRHSQKAHALMTPKLETIQTDKALATKYVLLDEVVNACQNCPAALARFVEQLGTEEAARALGQYYVRENQIEKAFALLQPYTEHGLSAYRQAEAAYNEAIDTLWNETLDFLNSGQGPEQFYVDYERADEAGQQQLLDNYFAARMENSDAVQTALAQYQQSASIVPVALDLGIVRLNRATAMADSTKRQAELEAAEAMFLSVKSFAGESDDYQLYLGQVYYWLGREDEGDQLFHNLIEKYGRSHQVLGSIASVLRNLGASTKARDYVDEAYQKAEAAVDKQSYAYTRFLLSEELEERIAWLEKSDTSQAYVRADLFAAKADQALRNNNKNRAETLYQQAIDAYATLPESAFSYNNVALIYMSKFRLSGLDADYDAALANMDKAVELSPDDSIVLSNAADYYTVRTLRDTVKNDLNLALIHDGVDYTVLAFLYDNEEEKRGVIDRIKANPTYNKMMDYHKRAWLLSPKNVSVFSEVYQAYRFLWLDEEVDGLLERLSQIGLELESADANQIRYRSGENDTTTIESINKWLVRAEERYSALDSDKNPLEAAILQTGMIDYRLSLARFGEAIDVDSLLAQAEKNYRAFPSSATRDTYVDAMLRSLLVRSQREIPAFAEFYTRYHRIYSDDLLLAMAVHVMSEYRTQIKQWSLLKTLLDTVAHTEAQFPSRLDNGDWFLLDAFEHPWSKENRTRYQASAVSERTRKIEALAGSNKEKQALGRYIHHYLHGDMEKADSVLSEGIAAGLLLPPALQSAI